ncbi:hypothetical protein KPH14_003512 [Odynerus spinipes]|uniref:Uncharacterized protein n=1 Tax=Odynerus spinipes TaxID=1348599 RepID=A0AAD9VK26_9HYME|nr:hypothetical protein KPH14_003512 [Odynerus spinipes]
MRHVSDPEKTESMSLDDISIKTEIIEPEYENKEKTVYPKQAKFENCDEITYLARIIKEKEALSKKLRTLQVQLLHEVPPQHKVEKRSGTHAPTREEIERFTDIVPIKKGSFSPEEDEIIVHNWKKFCKLHKWNKHKYRAFLYLRDSEGKKYTCKKKQTKMFVQFLANGLPNRTLYSVYHRFRILYSSYVQRRYTDEEDTMILNHIDHNPYLDEKRKFVDLAKVLNRTRASVWRHYRLLKKKQKVKEENEHL